MEASTPQSSVLSIHSCPARLRVEIRGAVQGVGFRPFVYRLATELELAGWVINDARGVFVEVEGPRDRLDRFLARLPAERPPRAIIHTLDAEWRAPSGYTSFEIRHSDDGGAKTAPILPDIATCPDCLAELLDPANRRFGYPFTNCTNCGPRLTIIQTLPYDRPNTTMRRFAMCPACQAEYESPLDRRFHAQPNACPVCGPQLELWEVSDVQDPETRRPGDKERLGETISWSPDLLVSAAAALRAGQIVAVKGLGGFHLMVDARDAAAVARLRARKRREEKPFALMARDLEQARALCEVSPEEAALLESPEAPIVLMRRKRGAPVATNVAPRNPTLGVMLPATPLHHLLLRAIDFPVVATSGNLSDEPICTDEHESIARLGGIADRFLVHDRPIERHVDDSVAAVILGQPRLLRRARGYAPLPILLKREAPCILAVGAHLKNTVALSIGRQVFVSQHIGDLETPQAIAAFERVIADFLRMYEAAPVAIAHDLHPDYASTQLAVGSQQSSSATCHLPTADCRLIAVQHHHAHLAACLAENGADGPALGVTWDGTGYGADGTIWGGEFLLGDALGYTRVARLRPFRLPGGEAAVKAPGRVALALLFELFGPALFERDDLPPLRMFRLADLHLLGQMLGRGVNAPVTTSAGRLFDGVAALIGPRQQVSFEGQAAMELEWIADTTVQDAYPLPVEWTNDQRPTTNDQSADVGRHPSGSDESRSSFVLGRSSAVLDWRPLVEAVLDDLRRGVEQGAIAARFHNALVEAIVAVATRVGTPGVALTGGCFLNRLLLERAADRLAARGFEVLLHRQAPPGDGGISLGQIAVAAAQFGGM
jgi:hydrogenase maturation protein HypF